MAAWIRRLYLSMTPAAHVHRADAEAAHGRQGAHHVVALGLVEEEDGVHPVGVGAVQHEEVGEAGHRQSEVGLGPVPPLVVQSPPVLADDLHGGQELIGPEPGPVDDGVDRVVLAVGGDHTGLGDLGDRLGDQPNVVPGQGREPLPGDQRPLAPHRVVGGERLPQVGVLHLAGQVGAGQLGLHRRQLRVGPGVRPLVGQPDLPAVPAGGQGHPGEPSLLLRRERLVEPGGDPDRASAGTR